MTIHKKIEQLSDNEILGLYQNFSGYLRKEIQFDAVDVIKNPPGDLGSEETINLIQKVDLEEMDSIVKPEEMFSVVRTIIELWADNHEMAPILDEFMKSHKINTLDGGIILATGSVIVMIIISTSLKVEYKDEKLNISYDSGNISDNAVKIVKAVLDKFPKSIKSILD